MDELEKNIYVNELFDAYRNLLTEHQVQLMELYYGYDLSLSEIATQLDISRNAVHDTLKKSLNALENYEEKLHLVAKQKLIIEISEKLKASSLDKEKLIEKVERLRNYGV